jgi:L-iditol 2-dehydrogenase
MMNALVLEDYCHLVYRSVPEPSVGPEDVLVEVRACGICGSDVHGLDGSTGRRIPPMIMGHEAAGTVAEVGAAVSDWQQGDRVTFDSTIYCGTCYFCRRGQINLCDNRRVLGVSCAEYRQDGALAQYIAVPQHILYRLPDDLDFRQAAMVEALSIAVHAVERAPISLDDTAIVVGTGMIGLLIVQVLRAAGCGRIIAVDIDQDRLNLARELGADEGLDSSSEDIVAQVRHQTAGQGAAVAFEAVGLPPTVSLAVQSIRKGGAAVLVGNVSPSVEFPLQVAVTRELTLYGSCASRGEYPACLNMMARGTVDVRPLISVMAPLTEGAQWFERLYNREPGLLKVILTP